jgi:pyruvate dehydrogenase E1 component
MEGMVGPVVAASDYVRAVSEQVAPFLKAPMFCLGTDGMGRSETRPALRRHFEVDAEFVALASLYQLAQVKQYDMADVAKAIKLLDIDPNKVDPYFA